jgi:hypothetical protein
LRAEVERLLTVGRASGADDVGACQSCELRHHRPDCACRAVREDALPRLKVAPTPVARHIERVESGFRELSDTTSFSRRNPFLTRFSRSRELRAREAEASRERKSERA